MIDRFMDKVSPEPTSGCWLWTATCDSGGYGSFSISSRVMRGAHRVSFEIFKGPISEGMQIDHLCRVHCCVNPDHLEQVTQLENQRRMPDSVRATITERAVLAKTSKLFCKRGHAFDITNTYMAKGRRACRTCARYRDKLRGSGALRVKLSSVDYDRKKLAIQKQ